MIQPRKLRTVIKGSTSAAANVLASTLLLLTPILLEAKPASVQSNKAPGSSVASAMPPSFRERQVLKDARRAFEKKDFQRSINLYSKIPTTSDYWPDSIEEKAWAFVHVKEHDEALSIVKTLTAPPLKYEIGAETYLLSGIVQLRLCNYRELFKIMKRFRDDVKPRFEALSELANTGSSPSAEKFLSRSFELQEVSRQSAGEDLKNLPRLVYRDKALRSAFLASMKPGSDRQMAIVNARLKSLAQRDVREISEVLRKFHLMEVEAVSRMYSKVHLADAKTPSKSVVRDSNTLVFPDDPEDVWLDELDKYHVEASGCPGAPSASSAADKQAGAAEKGPKS